MGNLFTIARYKLTKATTALLKVVLDLASAKSSKSTNTHCRDVSDNQDGQHGLLEMIGLLTVNPSEDWGLLICICEQASATEASAKEATEALSSVFKHDNVPQQLSATRLWAFMLLNTSELFVSQCAKSEFLNTLEDVLNSRRTSPAVCERLLDVLAGAAYATSRTSYKNVSGFGMLWRKVKPAGKPDQGMPLNPDYSMGNDPSPQRSTEIGPTSSSMSKHPQSGQAAAPPDNNSDSYTMRVLYAFGWKKQPFRCSICLKNMLMDSISRNASCGHVYCYECLRGQVTAHLDRHSFPILCPACTATKGKKKVFECCICMDEMPVDSVARIDSCGHTFCRDCLRGHVKARLEERKFPILCPTCTADECKGKRKAGEVSQTLALDLGVSEEQFNIWTEMEMVPLAVLVHCRKCQRSMFVARDEHEKANTITCPLPKCDHRWCKKCEQSVDFGVSKHSCDGTAELDQLMKEKGWKYCPACKAPIEKISGCNHMSCRTPQCNTQFCYACGGFQYISDVEATTIYNNAKKCKCRS